MTIDYHFYKIDPKVFASLEKKWQKLQAIYCPSFFLSWAFIGTFLKENGNRDFYCFEVQKKDKTLCLALFGKTEKGFYLHQTGDPEADKIYIEYNGFLYHPPDEVDIFKCFSVFMKTQSALFYFSGVTQNFKEKLSSLFSVKKISKVKSYGASLKTDYVQHFSKTTKRYLKKTQKYYQEKCHGDFKGDLKGDFKIERAKTPQQALIFLTELASYHNLSWQKKELQGAFENAVFLSFHQSLIAQHYEEGNLSLIKMSAGKNLIGYFYFFEHHKSLYYYQSGIHYPDDHTVKPGLYAHMLLMDYFKSQGKVFYDYMAGDQQYKRSLGQCHETLYWLRSKPSFLYYLKERISQWRS